MQIGYLQGASCGAVQELLWDFGQLLSGKDQRIVGMIERPDVSGAWQSKESHLEDIRGSFHCKIYQDLGSMAQSCTLNACAINEASGLVEAALNAQTDLLIISKFGKVEAETGNGFCASIRKATLLGVPVLTSVNPKYSAAWQDFAGDLAVALDPKFGALKTWWSQFDHMPRPLGLNLRAYAI